MSIRPQLFLAACLTAGIAALIHGPSAYAAHPVTVRPAIYRASATANVTPVGWGWHRGYGYYGYGSPYYRSSLYAPAYAYGYAGPGFYSPYGPYGVYSNAYYTNNYYRPYYTYPMGYYRYGYYSYPTYRMYGYPYSYNGWYPASYYGGYYPSNVGMTAVTPPVVNANVAPPVVSAPYIYGGYYTYPVYGGTLGGYGCCW